MATAASEPAALDRVVPPPGMPSLALGLLLAAMLVVLTTATWERWGDVSIDCGGALDRAARVAEGDVLYRDALEPYGPAGSYAIGMLFRIFGIHLNVAYAAGLAILLLESALLWYVCRPFLSALECGVGLVGFWVLCAFHPGILGWVLPNTFAGTLGALFATATAAALVADARRPGWRPIAVASVAAAGAGLSKIEFGAAAAGTLVVYALLPVHATRGRARLLLTALLPGLVVTLVVVLVFLALVPWRQLLFDNVYRVRSFRRSVPTYQAWIVPPLAPLMAEAALRYGIELPLRVAAVAAGLRLVCGGGVRRVVGAVVAAVALFVPLLLGYPPLRDFVPEERAPYTQFGWTHVGWLIAAVLALRGLSRRDSLASRAVFVAGTLSVLLSLRWQFHVVWPSFYAVFAPFLVVLVVRTVATRLAEGATFGTVLVLAVAIAGAAQAFWPRYARNTFALDYPRGRIRTTWTKGAPMAAVIDYLRTHTAREDYVAVIPEERLINFLAERRFPARDPGLGPGWLATAADEAQFIADLEVRRTEVVVVSARVYVEFRAGTVRDYNPNVMRYIETTYREEFRSGPYVVYRRLRT
jgi:hypothetical protein